MGVMDFREFVCDKCKKQLRINLTQTGQHTNGGEPALGWSCTVIIQGVMGDKKVYLCPECTGSLEQYVQLGSS